MKLENRYAQFAVYAALIALNFFIFLVLYRALDDKPAAPEAKSGSLEEREPDESMLEQVRHRIFGDSKPVKGNISATPVGVTAASDAPKFARTSFFFQAPYIGSIALPETWEGRYATKESGQSINFLYALPGEAGYPIFGISLVTKKEWDELKAGKTERLALKELSEHVFTVQLYDADIADQTRSLEFAKMREEAKAAWNSFRSYKQPLN